MDRESREVVVLVWADPPLPKEFERALRGSAFRVESCRTKPGNSAGAVGLALPRRSLYALDGELPQGMTEGIAVSLLSRDGGARLLVVAEAFTESSAFPLLRVGVRGLLTTSEVPGRLAWALTEVFQGGYWVPRVLLSGFIESALAGAAPKSPSDSRELTRREQEVMTNLLRNSSNKEIATRLRISERTAKFHVSNVLAKYGVRRRADLILLAYSAQRDS